MQLKARIRRQSQHDPERPDSIRSRKLPLEEIYSFFKDIASGLHHLHVNGYVHRDLKPSNCLLHDPGNGLLRVLVSDFGEVQLENMVRSSTGATGTILWCAPEVLRQDEDGELGNFSTKSDIFSLGMILYFLCFSRLPYRHADILNEENEDLEQLRAEITSWSGLREERKLRPDLPEKLYTFLRRLLSLVPADRPSAEEILHGIKTGSGLDEIADVRPPSAGHIFDDLRNTSRISPIDNPHGGGTPRPQTPTGTGTGTGRRPSAGRFSAQPHRAPTNIRLPPFQQKPSSRGGAAQPPPSAEDDPGGSGSSPLSPDSLVLREPTFPSSPTRAVGRRGLPAPPPRSSFPFFFSSRRFSAPRSLKLLFLLVKVFSINLLCEPMAARPVVAYPLLAFTAMDLAFTATTGLGGVGVSVLLLIVHLVLLGFFSASGMLCVSRVRAWEGL
ncbi:MAG: hypothetical protein Q9222_001661 [Ikaeria aurantiellina]